MELFDSHFSEAAGRKLKAAIAEAGGNEVYARGILSEDGVIEDVEIIARGNEHMVAAIMSVCKGGEYAIHNHPSASGETMERVLRPSDADVAIASQLGQRGVGSMIVDNAVRHSYVLVETAPDKKLTELPEEYLRGLMAPGGNMSKVVPDYEERPEQVEMMLTVARSFNQGSLAVVEAGTGTGKTLAYLVPAIAWALANREKVVIATHTINLQEQLIGKDLPLASQLFKTPPTAVLVKGRSNYVCRRKAMALRGEQELIAADEDGPTIQDLADWAAKTETGDRAELSRWPSAAVWEQVCAGRDSCLHSACPYFKECFVTRARRKADSADIIVTNHALLFSDIALKMESPAAGVLPAYNAVILDEAHNVEDAATDHFGISFSRLEVMRAIGGIYSERGHHQSGALSTLVRQVKKHEDRLPRDFMKSFEEAASKLASDALSSLRSALEDQFAGLREILLKIEAAEKLGKPDEEARISYRLTDERRSGESWEQLSRAMEGICRTLVQSQEVFSKFYALFEDESAFQEAELKGPLEDLKTRVSELQALATGLDSICRNLDSESGHVSWIFTDKQKNGQPKLDVKSLPVKVGRELVDNLYRPVRTVILTSATLSVSGSFDFLKSRIGLDIFEAERGESQRPLVIESHPSSFEYSRQAALLLPTDADPQALEYGERYRASALQNDAILKILSLTRGSAFILFTSVSALERTYNDLAPILKERGMQPMAQIETSRQRLTNQFKRATNGVLFGLESFWAGVDVSGEKLTSVIITKLPFPVPSEPIQEARSEALKGDGISPFAHFSLPQAVIKLRQGFGRLIRSRSDYGIVSILDSRIITARYGRTFLNSLPDCPRFQGTLEEILPQAAAFLADCRQGRTGE